MPIGHYGSKISENMKRTPEDFLVCYNVPIARTGTQEYLGSELGLYDRPNDIIKVYREPEEVFSKKTIASFEGKPFVDEHPGDWVTPLNFSTYGKGTVTNVRKGEGKDKNYLLADIVVYNLDQIEEIERKQKREVSCGYECEYVPFRDGYQQKNIVGNHVALVSAGRAGSKVAIRDSAKSIVSKHDNKEGVKKMSETGKYRIPVSHRRQKTSDYLKAVGLKQVAMDAEPEDILDAMNELVEEKKEEEKDNEPIIIEREGAEDEDEEKSDEMNEMKESLKEVKDALYSLLYTRDEEGFPKNKEVEDEENCEGMESLDNFEGEMTKGEEPDDVEDGEIEEIESVEKPPQEINDELEAEKELEKSEYEKARDSAVELVRVLKPIISYIPDKKTRKRVSDNLVKVLRKQVKDSKTETRNSRYSGFIGNRTKDSRKMSDAEREMNIGAEIAKKYNPHYNK